MGARSGIAQLSRPVEPDLRLSPQRLFPYRYCPPTPWRYTAARLHRRTKNYAHCRPDRLDGCRRWHSQSGKNLSYTQPAQAPIGEEVCNIRLVHSSAR